MAKPLKNRGTQPATDFQRDTQPDFSSTLLRLMRYGMWTLFIFLVVMFGYMIAYHIFVNDMTWLQMVAFNVLSYAIAFMLGQVKLFFGPKRK